MQILSQTAGYAILTLCYLHGREAQWVPAKLIADATGIPKPYLSRILHVLAQSGFIISKRGVGGGVALAFEATEISVWDVAELVDPTVNHPSCILGFTVCSDQQPCPAHQSWKTTQSRMRAQLRDMTIADVAAVEQAESGRIGKPNKPEA